uniref:G_PROTEIN_RECEP_F1_2 domain-containing protein n=1 Tax=Heterorhabditis bacteriophora TaxID=37862 RepID=A0A1I7W6M5_HETBA
MFVNNKGRSLSVDCKTVFFVHACVIDVISILFFALTIFPRNFVETLPLFLSLNGTCIPRLMCLIEFHLLKLQINSICIIIISRFVVVCFPAVASSRQYIANDSTLPNLQNRACKFNIFPEIILISFHLKLVLFFTLSPITSFKIEMKNAFIYNNEFFLGDVYFTSLQTFLYTIFPLIILLLRRMPVLISRIPLFSFCCFPKQIKVQRQQISIEQYYRLIIPQLSLLFEL